MSKSPLSKAGEVLGGCWVIHLAGETLVFPREEDLASDDVIYVIGPGKVREIFKSNKICPALDCHKRL